MEASAKWVSRRWWNKEFELIGPGGKLASMSVRGFRATAAIGDREFRIRKRNWPPTDTEEGAVTIRDAATDKVVARFAFADAQGAYHAEISGNLFWVGWVRWWKREWAWTNAHDERVLTTRRRWSGIEVRPAAGADSDTWTMLALLHLAILEVSRPWFRK
jgi:hypothetical protein